MIYLLIAVFYVIFSYFSIIFSITSYGIFSVVLLNILEYFSIAMIFISIYYTYMFNLYKAALFGLIGALTSAIIIGYALVDFFENIFGHSGFWTFIDINFTLIMGIVFLVALFGMNLYLIILKKTQQKTNTLLVKETILELGTKFTSLHVKEISQISKTEKSSIINIIKEMIEKGEIYAEYFSNTNIVAFDQSANIEDIDNLMAQFKKLEDNKIEKV